MGILAHPFAGEAFASGSDPAAAKVSIDVRRSAKKGILVECRDVN